MSVKGDAREAFGRVWSTGTVTSGNGASATLVAADANRGGLRIFPHATVDIWVNIAGATATGSTAAGEDKIAAGGTIPTEYLGADCPTNAVTIYTASSVSVRYQTRGGSRT